MRIFLKKNGKKLIILRAKIGKKKANRQKR